VARLYRKHAQASKLRYVPLRDLRHTHGTLLLEAGVNIVVVSRRLGHSTVAITDKHYLQPKRAADQAAADAFGELLAGVGGKEQAAGNGGLNTNAKK
jgi:integrase